MFNNKNNRNKNNITTTLSNTATPMSSPLHFYNPYNDPKYATIWKQLGYIFVTILALYMVLSQQQQQHHDDDDTTTTPTSSTTGTTRNSHTTVVIMWKILLHHEPSWRIFRSLLEINLCLVMFSFSLYIYRMYIGIERTHSLLFTPVSQILLLSAKQSPRHHHIRLYESTTATKTNNTTNDCNDDDDYDDNDDCEENDEVIVLLETDDDNHNPFKDDADGVIHGEGKNSNGRGDYVDVGHYDIHQNITLHTSNKTKTKYPLEETQRQNNKYYHPTQEYADTTDMIFQKIPNQLLIQNTQSPPKEDSNDISFIEYADNSEENDDDDNDDDEDCNNMKDSYSFCQKPGYDKVMEQYQKDTMMANFQQAKENNQKQQPLKHSSSIETTTTLPQILTGNTTSVTSNATISNTSTNYSNKKRYRRMVSSSVPTIASSNSWDSNNTPTNRRSKYDNHYVPLPREVLSIALDMFLAILLALFGYAVASSGYIYLLLSKTSITPTTLAGNDFAKVSSSTTEVLQGSRGDDGTSKFWMNMTVISLRQILLDISQIAAPTFPLLLILYLSVQAIYPWDTVRRELWMVLYRTIAAPTSSVTFRDGFIGDILTSTVRPLQDLLFTTCYIVYGLNGWWSSYNYEELMVGTKSYNYNTELFGNSLQQPPPPNDDDFLLLTTTNIGNSPSIFSTSSFIGTADANVPVIERSWLIHTILLPACMISPLWWRFLQTLRQVYDNKHRWPYLGNTLKYFVAAQVAMIGVYQPQYKTTMWWLSCFVLATCYQIYWDIFMDWNLLERVHISPLPHGKPSTSQVSSSFFGIWPISLYRLRSKRLYPSVYVYWFICGINVLLRFCWTLSFIPPNYLDAGSGLLRVNELVSNEHLLGPFIASAEIIRRSLWGLLRVEWESIKVSMSEQVMEQHLQSDPESDPTTATGWSENNQQQEAKYNVRNDEMDDILRMFEMKEMEPMVIPDTSSFRTTNNNGMDLKRKRSLDVRNRLRVPLSTSTMSSMDDVQIFLELSLYTAIFAVLGFIWAYHRGTL